MFKQNISFEVWGGEAGKYRLRDDDNNPLENTPEESCARVAKALSEIEPKDHEHWYEEFKAITGYRFAGGGRIMANAGSGKYKKGTSPINCTVMKQIPDSMSGIMDVAKDAALTLRAGCGVGYDFSTIRPKGSHVFGAGAATSGIISFMKIFDSICSTIMSGGARRGAQMACLDVSSPEIEDFITEKRKDGQLRYFNCSVLICDEFMNSVEKDETWDLWFWEKNKDKLLKINKKDICVIRKDDIPYNHRDYNYFSFAEDHTECVYKNCNKDDVFFKKIFKTVKAKDLFDLIITSTYNFWEPGFLLIDRANKENNLYFCETFRCSNPCGEQILHPATSCLLGSMILPAYVKNEFEKNVSFDFEQFSKDIRVASRLLDNVVEINNLPLPEMQEEIINKRRHGLGFTGVGSLFNLMGFSYGSKESKTILDKISYILAKESLLENINLAKEKGCAPIFSSKENREAVLKSVYLKRLLDTLDNKKEIMKDILEYGLRYSHATSIAPTGTLSLTWGNNCSNGIEPVFANSYLRNIRDPNKKTKVQEEVFDYSYFLWKEKFKDKPLPSYWSTTDTLNVEDHLNLQAIAQKWCDSAISKTINVPADYSFEKFKNVYLEGWKLGLKGVTTYRPNAAVSSGVLTQKQDLENTEYIFMLEDGSEVKVKGSEFVEYDNEKHNVANLFDALKEGIYGKM
jgi:ribonucleoside-diphosphate reductase alpha chain